MCNIERWNKMNEEASQDYEILTPPPPIRRTISSTFPRDLEPMVLDAVDYLREELDWPEMDVSEDVVYDQDLFNRVCRYLQFDELDI